MGDLRDWYLGTCKRLLDSITICFSKEEWSLSHSFIFPLSELRTVSNQSDAVLQETVRSDPRFLPTSAIALLVAISYYVGSQIGFFFTPAHSPIAVFWPPNAILLAVFLLTPPRIWWVLLLGVLPAHLFIQLRTGIPVLSSLGWFVGNSGEALLGAACIRYFKKEKPLFESVRGIFVFMAFGVLLPTLVTSFVDAASTVLTGLGPDYWTLWTARLTSNMTANLIIVPTIVTFGVKGISSFRGVSSARYIEAVTLALAIAVVSLLVFSREGATGNIPAFIYAPLPLLLWAAVRFGPGGLSASMLAVALISVFNGMPGRGPFGSLSVADDALSLHILLMVFAFPLLLLSALIAERSVREQALRGTRIKLVDAQEQERHRIARELHDGIVQQLTLVGLSVNQLRSDFTASERPVLDRLYDQISDVSNATRDLSHELHPFTLEYLGLVGALKKLCRDIGSKSALTITFSEEGVPSCLPSDICHCLFRVAQEALQNVVTHSHAKAASMELAVLSGHVLLRIVDDGVGITPEQQHSGGMGLISMRERVWALDGTCKVISGPLKGTIVEVSLPPKEEQRLSE
ncbi:MAG TPA: MASE1 domain-containing protein [Candidatus Sulfotelmatobacter sp.]|nr:MASE1 domain-containing protein [Candidatus Sulfotelmatobacter sp.]